MLLPLPLPVSSYNAHRCFPSDSHLCFLLWPFPLILILFLTFLDSQSWPPDFPVTNTTSLSAWHSLEDYCFARASENFLLSWPWQPPLSVVYLEKKEGQRPPHRNICVSTHFLRSTWTIFLHTMLAIRGGLMLLLMKATFRFRENHIHIYIKPSYVRSECLCPGFQEVIGQGEDKNLRRLVLKAVS